MKLMTAVPANHMDCQASSQLESGGSIGADPALQVPKTAKMSDWDKKEEN